MLREAGCDTRMFDPQDLPLAGNEAKDNDRIAVLHADVAWADGFVWCSPEHHGAMSGVMKLVLDCFPCFNDRPTEVEGKAVAFLQVAGGRICGGAIGDMQRVASSMGLLAAPRSLVVAQAALQFDRSGSLNELSLQIRLADIMRQLVKLSEFARDAAARSPQFAGRDMEHTQPALIRAAASK